MHSKKNGSPSPAAQVAPGDAVARSHPRRKLAAARARRRRMYWRRRMTVLASLALVALGASWLASGSSPAAVGASGDPRNPHTVSVKLPSLVPTVPEATRLPGAAPTLPFVESGQSAVFVDGVGILGATAHETSVPMASVTKIMTAVIVLKDHPLGNGSGPVFTMTEADHEAWVQAVVAGDSSLEVVAGERLTERQLLEALMIPSACNIADYLARWDAGSIAAFVRKMNAMASALGLSQTHYADASGVNPGSRSTALDQAILGAYALGIPGMVSIEDHPEMAFPVEGMAPNYNPALGQEGVIGIKSGFTDAAQACLVAAAPRTVGGRSVLVVAATLGQPDGLDGAAEVDLQLLSAATDLLESRTVLRSGQVVAQVVAGWTSQRRKLVLTGPITVVGWAGLSLKTVVKAAIPLGPASGSGWKAGTKFGYLTVSTPGGLQGVHNLKLDGFLPSAPAGWSASATVDAAASNS